MAKWLRLTKYRRCVVVVLVVLLGLGFWFGAVEYSVYIGRCLDCRLLEYKLVYRFLGIPIRTQVIQHNSVWEWIASDLGVSCQHRNYESNHKERWWGLVVCRCPCWQGTHGVYDDELEALKPRYAEELRPLVRKIGESDPSVGEEFSARVMHEHDFRYAYEFLESLLEQTRRAQSSPHD